jgi:hypothetical protein
MSEAGLISLQLAEVMDAAALVMATLGALVILWCVLR